MWMPSRAAARCGPPFADADLARRDERDYFHAEGRRLKATLRALLG
ncbi:hypothetical protein MQC88_10545 [Luteimonas sp. 50]|uniref:Uncharacterized protein n=1 Tax=Cognatiluteimonas sedimenti TaxID=2927791 RepID=A0ABT0A5X3_9GAMM|nr:hypothetical protein [Lysobacter sedimenti]MCJ0826382.1 hypothetical protein [Lysobacter sedimenti]